MLSGALLALDNLSTQAYLPAHDLLLPLVIAPDKSCLPV